MKKINVTEKELGQILTDFKAVKGMPIFASIFQATQPKCTVKSRTDSAIKNPYAQVVKLSKVSILLNSDYEKAVTNQLAKENKEATEYKKGKNTMPLVFGENNQFIGINEDNNEFVLQYRPNDNVYPQVVYFADGKLTDKSKLVDFLPAPSKATNQGTEREIQWRKVYLSNVLRLTFNGKTYNVIR